MKRKLIIILTLIITLFSFNEVYALSNWTENANEQNIVSAEARYKWYKEKLIDIGYSNDTNIDLNNTYIDKNDYIVEYTDWNLYDGNMMDNLEFRTWYTYQNINSLRYIELSNLNMFVRISEIEVLVDNKKVDYDVSCGSCDIKTYDIGVLKDNIIEPTNNFYLNNRTKLVLQLDEDYPMDKIELIIHFVNKNENNTFNLYFSEKQYKYDNVVYKENFDMPTGTGDIVQTVSYKIDDSWTFNAKYTEPVTTLEPVTPSWYTKVTETVESREVIKKYHYYNIEKEYLDGYYLENPIPELNLKKDVNNYKIFYKYTTPVVNNNVSNLGSNYNNLSLLSSKNNSDMDNLLKLQTNNFNVDDYYKTSDLSTVNYLANNVDKDEKIVETDKSKFNNKKIENKNISKYIDFKLLTIVGTVLLILILIILLINKRYRKN